LDVVIVKLKGSKVEALEILNIFEGSTEIRDVKRNWREKRKGGRKGHDAITVCLILQHHQGINCILPLVSYQNKIRYS